MCCWLEKSRNLVEEMRSLEPEDWFDSRLLERFPYSRVKRGHCLCGTQLDPAKLTQPLPAYLCASCFDKIVRSKTDRCILCGKPLSFLNIYNKALYPREVQFRMCEDKCLSYWTFFVSIILGVYDPNRGSLETSVFESVFGMNYNLPEPKAKMVQIPQCQPAPKLLEAEHTEAIRFSDWVAGPGSSTKNSQEEISFADIEKLLQPTDEPNLEPVKVAVPRKPQRPKRKRITLPENGKAYDIIDI